MSSSSSPTTETSAPTGEQSTAKYVLFSVVTVVFIALDQISKIWIQRNVELYKEEIPVIDGFFSIVHAENTGAAFGILNDSPYRMWVFAAFTVVAVVVLFQTLWQLPKDDKLQNVAVALIMSGAIGNAIDRLDKQSVTDFLKVYVEKGALADFLRENGFMTQWPSFNIADAAIVVGLGLFFVHFLFFEKDSEEVEPAPAAKPVSTDAEPAQAADDVAAPEVAAPEVAAAEDSAADVPTERGEDAPRPAVDAGEESASEDATDLVTPTEMQDLLGKR